MAQYYISTTPLSFPYVLQSTDYGKVVVASSTGNVETANVTLEQLQTLATTPVSTIATPTVSSVAVTDAAGVVLDDLALGDLSYLTVYGTNFGAGALVLVGSTAASSTTGISGEELRASFAGSNVAAGTYNVTVLNTNGTSAIKQNAVTFSPFPAWNTTGVLSATTKTREFSRNLALATPGDSAISYSLQNGTLPPGTTLTGGTLAGNIIENPASTTVYSFTLKAEDAELQGAPKTFTLNTGFLKNFSGNANVIITTDGTFSTTTNHLAVSNSGGFVKLVGSGFAANASILLANAALGNTTFVSSTELRAQIPAASEGTVSSLEIVNTDGSTFTNGNIAQWAPPAWTTPAGQLGNAIIKGDSYTRTVAKPTHSAGNVAYSVVSKPSGVAVQNSEDTYIWTSRTSAADNSWHAVAWAPSLGLFVAVGGGTVMTSSNGILWTLRSSPTDYWNGIAWAPALGLFAAVSIDLSANGTGNRVMTSTNGINWTARATPAGLDCYAITWSPELGLFVTVRSGQSSQGVATSSDGITWTLRTTPFGQLLAVAWAPALGLFAAVGAAGSAPYLGSVITSPNGIVWTSRAIQGNDWRAIAWAPSLGLFAAVSRTGSGNRVVTSSDGINWTSRTSAADNEWVGISWSPELGMFAAVSTTGTGNRIMTSLDGINWTSVISPADNSWTGIAWAPALRLFAAVATSGSGNRVMTLSANPPGNIIVSGTTVSGGTNENLAVVLNAISTVTLQNSTREFTLSLISEFFVFTTHTFTNASVTGFDGPGLTQVREAYQTTWDETYVGMTTNGIQIFTIPKTGTYRITAKGAQGGNKTQNNVATGGYGIAVQSTYTLTIDTKLSILVGQNGVTTSGTIKYESGGGGGASFVVNGSMLLLAAGGGGGAGTSINGEAGLIAASGGAGSNPGSDGNGSQTLPGSGGANGGGGLGARGGGGAGYMGNGSAGSGGAESGGKSFVNGGKGGKNDAVVTPGQADGGFGGGGWTFAGGGGGGGYSGGGAGGFSGSTTQNGGRGGGGGSYSSTTMTNLGTSSGNGYVIIELIA